MYYNMLIADYDDYCTLSHLTLIIALDAFVAVLCTLLQKEAGGSRWQQM